MPAQHRSAIAIAAASLITLVAASVAAAEDAVKDTNQASASAQGPAPRLNAVKPASVAALPVSTSSVPHHIAKSKSLSRYYYFFTRVRCVHIGCEGVHTLGTAY